MFKDPLYREETPYDILDLHPDASHNEVHQALPKFMRNPKNIPRLGKAQHANAKLRNSKERVAIDILYYSMGKMDGMESGEVDINNKLNEFLVIPCLKDNEFYSDLKKWDFSDDCREINFSEVKVNELIGYDDIKRYKLEAIPFDK